MLTSKGCRARRERLWAAVAKACDAIVITSPEHLAYLAGYWPSPFTFRTNEAGAALILTRDRATLVGDNLLEPFLEQAFVDDVVAPEWYRGQRAAGPRRELLCRTARSCLEAVSRNPLGVESASVPLALVDGASTLDVTPLLLGLRRTKHPDEIETLRAAIGAAERGMAAGARAAVAGASEIQVYAAVAAACHAALGTPALVYGDFAAGRRAMGPDTLPTGRLLREGDLLILDFSVVVRGYRGDFANSVCVGAPSQRQCAAFDACQQALARVEPLLLPGAPCQELDRAVRATLRESGFAADRPGHVGHGIGLAHPEAPYFVAESAEFLQMGDVVTLEPSLFPDDLDGGVRLEHNYHVTASGPVRLSAHSLGLEPERAR